MQISTEWDHLDELISRTDFRVVLVAVVFQG